MGSKYMLLTTCVCRRSKSNKDFLFIELQVLLLWFHQTGDKNLEDKTPTGSCVHSCGLDVVSSYVKVFLCAATDCFIPKPPTVITLRLICLLSADCHHAIIWKNVIANQYYIKPNKQQCFDKTFCNIFNINKPRVITLNLVNILGDL